MLLIKYYVVSFIFVVVDFELLTDYVGYYLQFVYAIIIIHCTEKYVNEFQFC